VEEFDRLRLTLCKPLQDTINGIADPILRLIRARREFAKAGFVIEYRDAVVHSIRIGDEIRCSQVSVLEKIAEALPSMTNALESRNGHLNHIVVRNNSYWASLCHLA
jgi:hypothetical protein